MFYGFVVTEAGNHLLAQMVAGETLELTRVVMDKGTAESAESARALTAPLEPMAEGTSTIPLVEKNTVNLVVEYRSDLNGGLEAGFWIGGFAIYAKDLVGGADIMLYYCSLGDAKQYVSAYTQGSAPDVRRYLVSIALTEGVEVTVDYPADAWMSAQDMADYFNATLKPELLEEIKLQTEALAESVDELELLVNTKETPTGAQEKADTVQTNLNSHTSNVAIHIAQADKDVWNAKETPAGAQAKVDAVQTNLNSHTGNSEIHVTQADKDTWSAKETPAGAQEKADTVQTSLDSHAGNKSNPHGVTAAQVGADAQGSATAVQGQLDEHKAAKTNPHEVTATQVGADPSGSAAVVQGSLDGHTGNEEIHVMQADKDAWNAKETPAGAQAKADAVQSNLTAHTGNQSNPHRVTAAQTGAADISLSNVTNANFKAKAESAGAAGQKIYDQVIRTQAEFNALIASPTWFGAVSVCFIGDGGTLKFTRSDGQGCKIPQTVKHIQGMNNAAIEVTNFVYNATTNRAALWYATLPTTDDYWVDGLSVKCAGTRTCNSFYNCAQVTNCTGTGNNSGSGFYSCTRVKNCTGTGNNSSQAFYNCAQVTNCTGNAIGGNQNSGFYFCVQLINCIGISDIATAGAFAFSNCTQLTNCTGYGIGVGAGSGYGFYSCSYLNGCKQGAKASTTAFLGGTNTKVDTLTVVAS